MFTARRWWEHKALHIGLLVLVVGSTWTLRQTQGAFLMEIYQTISRPIKNLQPAVNPEDRIRNAKILELQTRVVELETQNQQLKNLLNYVGPEKPPTRPIIARVVGRSADQWWQQVTLNSGTKAGVKEGFVVRAEGGLVGLVQSVTPNTSRVLLISDLKSQVGVTISRTNAKGVLRGDSSNEGVLEFYEKIPDVTVGDLVSTSTYSQKYPAGIPVGKIKSVNLKKLPASVAEVELFPPIRYLDWVTIHPGSDKIDTEITKPENQKPQTSN
ncbi:MAG: rod shape-determining protein MreC [Sphaerospermopsis sp. SIO1G2]|nr:rod shape-determining protein MreC [Sphaerospermopsis sp. SIO1G1]NET70006.1 rod shape-determining protein MreC [Sphaerospermopsis sp. SIO1G2]